MPIFYVNGLIHKIVEKMEFYVNPLFLDKIMCNVLKAYK